MEIRYRLEKRDAAFLWGLVALHARAVWLIAGVWGLVSAAFVLGSDGLAWGLGAAAGVSLVTSLLHIIVTCVIVGIGLALVLALLFYHSNKNSLVGQWRIVLGEEMLAVENERCTNFYSYGRFKGWRRWGGLLLLQMPELAPVVRRCFKDRDEEKEFLRQLKEKAEAAQGRIELEFPAGESRPWFSFWFYTDPSHAVGVQRTAVDIVNQLKLNRKMEKRISLVFLGMFVIIAGRSVLQKFGEGEFLSAAILVVGYGIIFCAANLGMKSSGKKNGKEETKLTARLSKEQIRQLVGKSRFFFYEDSFVIEEQEKGCCILWPYESVFRLVFAGNVFFFFVAEAQYTFLPAAIFQSQEEVQAFLGFLERKGITCTWISEAPWRTGVSENAGTERSK